MSESPDQATTLDQLRHCRVCDGLTESQLEQVAAASVWRKLLPGETLTMPGDGVFAVFTVVRGRLKLYQRDDDGEEHFIGYANQGESVGQSSLLLAQVDDQSRITADMDCLIAEIHRQKAQQLVIAIPRFRENLISGFGQRLNSVLRGQRFKRIPKVVGILRHESTPQDFLPILARELQRRHETITIFTHRPDQYQDVSGMVPLPDKPGASSPLRADIRQQIAAGRRVLIDIGLPAGVSHVRWLVEQCDELLWCHGTDLSVDDGRTMISQLVEERPDLESRLVSVEILGRGHAVGVQDEFGFSVHQSFRLPYTDLAKQPSWRFQQGLDRVVRHLRGVKIGLALGGGGARGLSHLGVLHVLDRAGISFDVMSGTSAGAMIGLGYAAGMSTELLIETFPDALAPPELLESIPGGRRLYLFAKFFDRAWGDMLQQYFHDWTFEQLLIPFSVVATDLVSGKQVVRETGDVVQAILESINVPVLSDPILKDGMVLVDGGVTNNLPVELLSEKGAEYVIGVDASKQIPGHFADNFPHMTTEQMKMPGRLETAYRVMEVSRRGIAELQMRFADLIIEPDTSAFDFADFTAAKEIASTGEAAAERMLPELQASYDELMNGSV